MPGCREGKRFEIDKDRTNRSNRKAVVQAGEVKAGKEEEEET